MIAALYVETNGVYFGLPDVDPWDEQRDARLYDGPWPVVAHPPCTHWSIMGQCRSYLPRPSDYATFGHALRCVREFGGVLEHPAHTKAWAGFGLPRPLREGWACQIGDPLGWTCEIDQANYGHPVNKRTWLYFNGGAYGVDPPSLIFGAAPPRGRSVANNGGGGRDQRSRTPLAFRDTLLAIARSVSSLAEAV